MRQILYFSFSTDPGNEADLAHILQQSRHNNAIDGVTGLLWSDGAHFIQVIEGPDASVELTWARIQADARHHQITVLIDGPVSAPEFGTWTMAHRGAGRDVDLYDEQLRRLLENVSPAISEVFLAVIPIGRDGHQPPLPG